MTRLLKLAFLLEMLALFAPALVAGLAMPMVFGAAMAEGIIPAVLVLLPVAAGAAGLYTAARLALHVMDARRRLPPRGRVLLGVAAGFAAAIVGILQGFAEAPTYAVTSVAPVLGMAHLLWLCRRELWPRAQPQVGANAPASLS